MELIQEHANSGVESDIISDQHGVFHHCKNALI